MRRCSTERSPWASKWSGCPPMVSVMPTQHPAAPPRPPPGGPPRLGVKYRGTAGRGRPPLNRRGREPTRGRGRGFRAAGRWSGRESRPGRPPGARPLARPGRAGRPATGARGVPGAWGGFFLCAGSFLGWGGAGCRFRFPQALRRPPSPDRATSGLRGRRRWRQPHDDTCQQAHRQ